MPTKIALRSTRPPPRILEQLAGGRAGEGRRRGSTHRPGGIELGNFSAMAGRRPRLLRLLNS
jgi:hypothetical protein